MWIEVAAVLGVTALVSFHTIRRQTFLALIGHEHHKGEDALCEDEERPAWPRCGRASASRMETFAWAELDSTPQPEALFGRGPGR
jgi:hypothetical protein